MSEPISRWTTVETIGRGVRAAPALRTGFGLTLTLAMIGAAGRVTIRSSSSKPSTAGSARTTCRSTSWRY